jgi:hypothetical protein
MFQAIKYCNSKYTASLNRVLDTLEQMELAEQQEEENYEDAYEDEAYGAEEDEEDAYSEDEDGEEYEG